ncbi:hypothetical protein OBB02_02485 [Candidatus Puniceispirillum sp.]|nr:hypothetical protein [Candidatus Puniceispirillum sp.]
MRMPDHDPREDCRVIPFVRPAASEDTILTSSIATVIAVTIVHREGESPEERLLDIIDASGEAEVLDVADVMEEHEIHSSSPKPHLQSDNDNDMVIL